MNRNYGLFGVGVQAAAGTAVAPTITFMASADSAGIDASTTSEVVRVTNGARDTTVGRYNNQTEANANVTTLAFADLIGALAYYALGSKTTTGSTAPYEHDIVMGESLPLVTFTQQVGASNAALQRLEGCKLNTLNITAEGVAPLSVEASFIGCTPEWLAATSWTGPAFKPEEVGWFTTAGATLLYSLDSDTPAAIPAAVTLQSVQFGIENAAEAHTQFGSASPSRVTEGSGTVTLSLSGTSTDTELYRVIKTGSAAGTTLAGTPTTGSLQVTFPHTVESDYSLVINLGAVPWQCDALQVSTEGGPFEFTISTDGAIAVDGTSIEFTVANGTASY